jgi:alpha-tubulin suppressor-like RCC1 family protein
MNKKKKKPPLIKLHQHESSWPGTIVGIKLSPRPTFGLPQQPASTWQVPSAEQTLSPRQKIISRPKLPLPSPPVRKDSDMAPALKKRQDFLLWRETLLPKQLSLSPKNFAVHSSPHVHFSSSEPFIRRPKMIIYRKNSTMTLYTSGDNMYGRLGIGSMPIRDLNKVIKIPEGKIEFAACGWDHTCIVTSTAISICGRGNCGQLGSSITDEQHTLESVHCSDIKWKNIISMSCGAYYTMLITNTNELFGCGDNSSGQLCLGNNVNRLSFYKVDFSLPMIEVVCGHSHTGLVTTDGELYMCGSNYFGQLMLGDRKNRNMLEKVTFFDGIRVKLVALGNEHSIVLTYSGDVYACGGNQLGQCGLDSNNNIILEVGKINLTNVYRVYAGQFHSIFYTRDHELYVCGSNRCGQLGIGDIEMVAVPEEVPFFSGRKILTVACTHAEHTLVLLRDGQVFGAGSNEWHQLPIDENIPTDKILFFQPIVHHSFFLQDIVSVACGPFHSLFVTEQVKRR